MDTEATASPNSLMEKKTTHNAVSVQTDTSVRRVLLIDDTKSILEDYIKVLKPLSYESRLDEFAEELFDDDDTDSTSSTAYDSSKYEFQIETATQGEQGYQLALKARQEGNPFQLAFVDMRMPPGWDGLKTVQAIMAADEELQFVVCTAYSDFSWAETVQALGSKASDRVLILKKPFDPSEVWQLAATLTEKWILARKALTKQEELEKLVEARTSELLNTHTDLVKAKNDAVDANRAKSRFLAGMSHELRNPLNAMIGIASILKDSPMPEEQKALVKTWNTSSDHLLSIINNILEISKIEAGKVELESISFDLQKAVKDIVDMLGRQAHEKGLGLWSAFPPWIPNRVFGDPTRIKQIITNLISNGIKFTENGAVSISADVSKTDDDPYMFTFTVTDTGIGIPQESIRHLFTEYTQADASTSRKFGGTGLGLQISNSLAELMGGFMSVESEEGVGSRFTLSLQLKLDGTPPESRPPIELEEIHVVDLSRDAAPLIESLKKYAKTVRRYSDHEDLLKNKYIHESSIIIFNTSDFEEEFFEFCLALNKRSGYFLKKVFLTRSLTPLNTNRMAEAGIVGHLPKPINSFDLLSLLTRVTQEHAQDSCSTTISQGKENAQQTEHSEDDLPAYGKFTGSVLLVEDNLVNQRITSMVLKRLGLSVDVAGNGLIALERTSNKAYDCIFMDCNMPEMDGIEATKRIRDLNTLSCSGDRVPIIAMTAVVLEDQVQKLFESGVDDYIPKPSKPIQISNILDKWIP